MKLTARIITAAATAISFVGLAFSDYFPPWVQYIIVMVGLICFGILVIDEMKSNHRNERVCRSPNQVEEAMKEVINSSGKICIMSRDLDWVTHEIIGCLEFKRKSVLIFAHSENEITKTLIDRGVTVKYYGHLGFEPKSRFTVIRYNKNDPQVVVANTENTIRKRKKYKHTMYETSPGGAPQDTWINSLAIDMVNLCNAVCKEVHYAKKG